MGSVNQEQQLERIADAMESISDSLNNINTILSRFEDCIGYIPPTPLQKEGYYIFRIGGCIDNGN